MDVITVCRTLNESANIERFCTEYSKFTDAILIMDGGSEDDTVEKAMGFEKVIVAGYYDRVYRDTIWRNPHGVHINRMIDWARKLGAEWVIFDDCDSLPNKTLKENFYIHANNPDCNVVGVKRLYLYKDQGYFPGMNSPNGFARWAWRTSVEIRADESDPWAHTMIYPDDTLIHQIDMDLPACLLHYTFPDDEEIERKRAFYTIAKKIPPHGDWNPLQIGGEIEPLPEWAVL